MKSHICRCDALGVGLASEITLSAPSLPPSLLPSLFQFTITNPAMRRMLWEVTTVEQQGQHDNRVCNAMQLHLSFCLLVLIGSNPFVVILHIVIDAVVSKFCLITTANSALVAANRRAAGISAYGRRKPQ